MSYTPQEYAQKASEATAQNKKLFVIKGNLVIDDYDKYVNVRGKWVLNNKWKQEKSERIRKYLIENINKNNKNNVIYSYIIVNISDEDIKISIDKDARTNLNTQLSILSLQDTSRIKWKCRLLSDDSPIVLDMSAFDYQSMMKSISKITHEVFELESKWNDTLQELTEDQLLDNNYVDNIIKQIQKDYKSVNTKVTL